MATTFSIGQKYQTKRNPKKFAEVSQVRDDPHWGWIQVRNADGILQDEQWVNFAQFIEHWERFLTLSRTAEEIINHLVEIARHRHLGAADHFLGFSNEQQEQLFRAVAGSHPKPVLVAEKDWRETAETMTEGGSFNCVIVGGGRAYKLTESGKRRAQDMKLLPPAD